MYKYNLYSSTQLKPTIFVVLPIMSTCEFIDFEIKWLNFTVICAFMNYELSKMLLIF